MKKHRLRSVVVVVVVLSAVCFAGPAQPQQRRQRLPEGVKAVKDLVYAKAGERALLLDLYLPEDTPEKPLPLIIWIHGGAWMAGDKERCPATPFVRDGYAAASICYRLSQDAIFPAQIHDCKAAIRWLRTNAGKYNLDPDRIGVWGSSAGGHLVALLGTTGDVEALEGDLGHLDQSSRVQAVCDFFGPTDFSRIGEMKSNIDHNAPDSPESRLIGAPVTESPELVARANPITYVTKDDPPFLIMHGDKDMTVPINQSELLHEALKEAGVEVTYKVVEGAGHGFGGAEIMAQVRSFFDEHLK